MTTAKPPLTYIGLVGEAPFAASPDLEHIQAFMQAREAQTDHLDGAPASSAGRRTAASGT